MSSSRHYSQGSRQRCPKSMRAADGPKLRRLARSTGQVISRMVACPTLRCAAREGGLGRTPRGCV